MRIFYQTTKTSEISCLDTVDTPIFISCRKNEVEFLKDTDGDTDGFYIPQDSTEEPEEVVESFVKSVYLINERLNAELINK